MPVSILPIHKRGSVIIRTAEERDTAALARLMTQLGYPTSPAEMGERLEAILRSPGYYTVVAEAEEEVIGMAGVIVGRYYERNSGHPIA
jgi:sarcosine oxidase gamma subunit